jgi:hypothetical protein
MLYLDTSLIVATLAKEVSTGPAQIWLASQKAALLVSEWTITEVSAALSIKLRTAQLNKTERALALAQFHRLATDSFTIATVDGTHFRVAAGYADQHTLGLRASDALHLAVASQHGATVCTLDHRLADAGPLLGVATLLVA